MICSIKNLAKLLKFRLGGKSLRLALSYLNKKEAENFILSVEKDTTIKEATFNQVKSIVNTVQFKYYPKVKMNLILPTTENKSKENKDYKDCKDCKEDSILEINKEQVDEKDINCEISPVKAENKELTKLYKSKGVKEKSNDQNNSINNSDRFHSKVSKNAN